MCDKCDEQLRPILADPERAQRLAETFAHDAAQVASAVNVIATRVTNDLDLGAHQGTVVIYAALSVVAEQILAHGIEGEAKKIAELVRAELAKRAFVVKTQGTGLGVTPARAAPAADASAPTQPPAKA